MAKLRAVHFTIGFPPLKGGGLVQYVVDLMEEQARDGSFEYVTAFYPGRSTLRPRPALKKGFFNGHEIYEIINPVPSTLTEGTRYPGLEVRSGNEQIILDKLKELKIDVVHFHTFFGISAHLARRIKQSGRRTVYTAHDYQPLCPKLHLLDFNLTVCQDTAGGEKCAACNYFALERNQIVLRNSRIGMMLQGSPWIKTLVKGLLLQKRGGVKPVIRRNDLSVQFLARRKAYLDLLNNHIDVLIYSSTVTQDYFERCGVKGKAAFIPVSNSKIKKQDYEKQFTVDLSQKQCVTFGYLGGNRVEKGYGILVQVFEQIWQSGITNWRLLLFSAGAKRIEIDKRLKNNIIRMGFQKGNVYNAFDILIVPSIWPETFGIVISESLIHRKMVIASDLVGGAHYFKGSGIIIYNHNDREELRAVIEAVILGKGKYVVKCGQLIAQSGFHNHYQALKKIYG